MVTAEAALAKAAPGLAAVVTAEAVTAEEITPEVSPEAAAEPDREAEVVRAVGQDPVVARDREMDLAAEAGPDRDFMVAALQPVVGLEMHPQ